MAQRRMFSPDIVSSEEFLDMPVSSRELYFQLGMNADDDGFIQPKLTMRITGATDDDLKVLLTKRFLLPFQNGVVVIKHWLIHNMIRADRYKPTRFQDEKKSLFIKENKSYTDKNPLGLQNGNQMAPQVRLGKVRLGKVIKDRDISSPKKVSCPLDEKKYPKKHNECTEYILSCEEFRKHKFINRAKQYMFLHKILRVGFDFQDIDRTMKAIDRKYGENNWDFATIANWMEKGG